MGAANPLRPVLPASHPARQALVERFDALGWPTRKHPAWQYTDLAPLGSRSWTSLPTAGGDAAPAATAEDDHFALLNAAFAPPATRLGETGGPDASDRDVTADHMVHRQYTLSVATDTRRQLVIDGHTTIEGLRTRWINVALAANSELDLVWIGQEQGRGHDLARLTANVGPGARLRLWVLKLGTVRSRLEAQLHLDDEGAQVEVHALALPRGEGPLDLPLAVHHHAPHCLSRMSLRAIGVDRTRSSFNGRVIVHEGAVKTDSEQHMASMLLSAKAEINAKPDLEIYNDDVKCAHGASFGQLDDDALFYLRARGVDRDSAKALLTRAFAAAVLDALPDALQAELGDRVLQQLAEVGA